MKGIYEVHTDTEFVIVRSGLLFQQTDRPNYIW